MKREIMGRLPSCQTNLKWPLNRRSLLKPLKRIWASYVAVAETAPLNGPSYQCNNAKVYGIIKQLALEGPGRTFILHFVAAADGRAAWLALWGHYKGNGFRNCNVDDAYTLLDHLSYSGEKRGFTFENFLQRHMECFLELALFNEPILETKRFKTSSIGSRLPSFKLLLNRSRQLPHS